MVLILLHNLANRYNGIRTCIAGNVISSIGYILLNFREALPIWASIVLANLLLVVGGLLVYIGLLRFLGAPLRIRWLVLLFALIGLSFLYFTYVREDSNARVVVIALGGAAVFLACAWALWSWEGGSVRLSRSFTAAVFGMYGGLLLARAALALVGRSVGGVFDFDSLQVLTFLFALTFLCLWSGGFVVMVSQRLYQDLLELATVDFLTQLLTRRAMYQALESEISRCERGGPCFALMLVDVDHFKSVNDTFGHQMGDRVLQHIAQTLKGALRRQDVIGRWGGEEFLAMLPLTDKRKAMQAGERLRATVEAASLIDRGQPIACTVSIGVAAYGEDGDSLGSLLSTADTALYRAKSAGRNRVESPPLDDAASAPALRYSEA